MTAKNAGPELQLIFCFLHSHDSTPLLGGQNLAKICLPPQTLDPLVEMKFSKYQAGVCEIKTDEN